MADEKRNRLGDETSPYLLQHADNPVHWYPWGDEALKRAVAENKPIFLSIGYSACHWCHVMAHESFEDADTAALMNEHFINIKVDREERPDLDHIYQTAYQLLAGRGGGWPLSMFLTPDLGPFWGGTYFPDQPRYNMPAFKDVLLGVVNHFRDKPDDVVHNVTALTQGLARINLARKSDRPLSDNAIEAAAQGLMQSYDDTWGGFGESPKFPSTMALSLLLRRWYRTGNDSYLNAVTHSLSKMAEGGIRDHLGGGFARYSVDNQWLVPHFEKMLYDNALLVPLYIDASLAADRPELGEVAKQILAYVMAEMSSDEGGFFSAQDADSEGEEGKFFVWRPGAIEELLGAADAALFCTYYGVTDGGNFEGQNILWTPEPIETVAVDFGITVASAEARLSAARKKLLARRAERIHPGLDDKIISAWNGLMVSAFARAYEVFGDDAYRQAAENAVSCLLSRLYADGRLLRCYKAGQAKYDGYLDDYAFVARGLLDLYGATGNAAHLKAAQRLMAQVQERFALKDGGYYFTADDHEQLISRTFDGMDQSIPSGNAVAAECLHRLHHLTGEADFLTAAESAVRTVLEQATGNPLGYAQTLLVIDHLLHPPTTVALAQPESDESHWHAVLSRHYLPDAILVPVTEASPALPWLQGKGPVDGKPTAYLCSAGTCSVPFMALNEVQKALGITST